MTEGEKFGRLATSVRQRVVRSLTANAYGQLVTVVVQLVGVPVLLHAWGAQRYGEWLILFAIPAYLSITDLGFSQSAANDMTARVARGQRVGAFAVFQTLGALVYTIVAVGLVLAALVIPWLPLRDWLHLQAVDESSARWTLWFLTVAVLAALPNGVNHAGFRASGDYALHEALNGTTRLAQFGGVWIVAASGGGLVAAAFAFCGLRVFGTLGAAVLLVYRHRWLHFGWAKVRRAELSPLMKPALANVAMPLAHALNVQGMVLVIGVILGPLAVVVFSTLRTLSRFALQLVLAVAHAAEPELAIAYGGGNRALMGRLFVHTLRTSLWMALAAVVGLAVFGDSILEIWTNGRVAMRADLFGWLLASAVASVLWYDPLIVLKAANRHLRAAVAYVLAAAAAVGMASLLLTWMGTVAYAGLVLLVMDMITAMYALHAAAAVLNVRPLQSLREAINPCPLVVLALSRVHARGRPTF